MQESLHPLGSTPHEAFAKIQLRSTDRESLDLIIVQKRKQEKCKSEVCAYIRVLFADMIIIVKDTYFVTSSIRI